MFKGREKERAGSLLLLLFTLLGLLFDQGRVYQGWPGQFRRRASKGQARRRGGDGGHVGHHVPGRALVQ